MGLLDHRTIGTLLFSGPCPGVDTQYTFRKVFPLEINKNNVIKMYSFNIDVLHIAVQMLNYYTNISVHPYSNQLFQLYPPNDDY